MKKYVALFFLSLIFSYLALAQEEITITGKLINNTSNFTKIQLKNLITKKVVASADINADGSFNLRATANYPNFYGLQLNNQNYILLVLAPGDNVVVTYDVSNPQNSDVKGSDLTQVLTEKKLIDNQINAQYEELQKKLQQEQYEKYKTLILNNLGKISSLLIAERLPMDQYIDVHNKLAESLEPYKANPYVKQYITNVYAYSKTKIGSIAPDIALPNPDGDTVRLSSLRGKYVLIDFWAGWCRPCRAESPNLVKAYNNYKDKGFTIYSVSLDNNRGSWLNAIQADNLGEWTHVSDLKGWRSSAAELYGVNSIPANFLIDPQGKIIAKNLRGQALDQKLQQIFNK